MNFPGNHHPSLPTAACMHTMSTIDHQQVEETGSEEKKGTEKMVPNSSAGKFC